MAQYHHAAATASINRSAVQLGYTLNNDHYRLGATQDAARVLTSEILEEGMETVTDWLDPRSFAIAALIKALE
jgi:hypothetical protein